MTIFTKEQENAINSVKKKMYNKLSYTSQSYEEIISDIIGLFRGENKLRTKWDNISESDIMFIFMSLLAAHKDMSNYMIDYRILESYMGTARESESIYRIAKSFGFKIPSYRPASTKFKVATLDIADLEVTRFKTFVDDSGVAWTYIGNQGEESKLVSTGDIIELFQGNVFTINNIVPDKIDEETRTFIIGNKSIAIGNNSNDNGCSMLYATPNSAGAGTDIMFTEVDNVYNYSGTEDYVYHLAVDPKGITYIQFPRNLDMSPLNDVPMTIVFKYLLTSGNRVTAAGSINTEINTTEIDTTEVTFEKVTGEFIRGSAPPKPSEIKYLFRDYYAATDNLITLEDYKNFILNIQRTVPEITKCLVADVQHDTSGGTGSSAPSLEIGVYVLKDNNEEIEWPYETIIVAATVPPLGDEGDYYYNTGDSTLYVATEGGWVVDEASIATTKPVSPIDGDRYVDTSLGLLYTYSQANAEALKSILSARSVSGINININEASTGLKPLTAKPVHVSTTESINTDVKEIIIDYINRKNIGENLTVQELVDELNFFGYSFRESTMKIGDAAVPAAYDVVTAFNEYLTCVADNITEVA